MNPTPPLPVTLQQRLRAAGVTPTLQRLTIAGVLLEHPVHMTAEQLLRAVRAREPGISRATVYATLRLFAEQGLVRELASLDGAPTVYDSNLAPHHHMFDVDSGSMIDIPPGQLEVIGMPEVGADVEVMQVDVVVRVRRRRHGEHGAMALLMQA
jgi:Fur family iron response transcriptional regulator